MNKKSQKVGKCIFCSKQGNLTKQHILPDWLKNVIPRQDSHLHFSIKSNLDIPNSIVTVEPNFFNKQGDVAVRKLRNVCIKCNGGWMSKLEQTVKPNLTGLILGNRTLQLDPIIQLDIARWVAMTVMVIDSFDPHSTGIPYSNRKVFMQTLIPPEGWTILLGRYRGKMWEGIRYKHHGKLIISKDDYLKINKPVSANTQSTTLVLGELFIYAISSSFSHFILLNFSEKYWSKLFPVWYPMGRSVLWPSAEEILNHNLISDSEADAIADALLGFDLSSL